MNQEFILEHCTSCDFCIYQNNEPWGCGEISDEGCCSESFRTLKFCREGHEPIAHKPKFKVGDRIDMHPTARIVKVVEGVRGYYLIQREGGQGRFNEPYKPEKAEFEDVDYLYEKIPGEDELVYLTEWEGKVARVITPGIDVVNGWNPNGYKLLKKQIKQLKELFSEQA